MLILKLEKMENFTNNEKNIAKFILENLSEFHLFSVEKLAKISFTSKASVIRLCKKLEVKGFRDFQRQIDKEYNDIKKIQTLFSDEPITSTTKYDEILTIIPSLYEKVITDTRLSLDPIVTKSIISKLKQINKIEIYGVGITHTLAKLAAFKFMTLGIESEAYDGINEHYVYTTKKGKNNMAFLISLSGNNPYIIKIAKHLKKRNVFVVGIGKNLTSEFEDSCSTTIEVGSGTYVKGLEMLMSSIGITYLLDVMFTSLLVENYYEHVNTSIEVNREIMNRIKRKNETKVSKK